MMRFVPYLIKEGKLGLLHWELDANTVAKNTPINLRRS